MRRSLANVFGQFTLVAFFNKAIEERPLRFRLRLQNRLVGSKRSFDACGVDGHVVLSLVGILDDECRRRRSHLRENLSGVVLIGTEHRSKQVSAELDVDVWNVDQPMNNPVPLRFGLFAQRVRFQGGSDLDGLGTIFWC